MTDQSLWVRVLGDASGAQTAMKQASDAVKDSTAQIREHMSSLTGVFEKVNVAMAGVAAVLAGGAAFKESVEETVKLTKEAQALGKQFGITASQGSVLAVALDDVHVSTEQAVTANTRITQALRTNEAAFTAMGIATRDSSGHFCDSLDVLMDVNAHLGNVREGIDRNIEGQKIYGRAWSEVSGTLRLTRESMEAAQQKADELGLTVGERSVANTKSYRDAMNDVGDVITAVKKAMGDALLPVLTKAGNWFASIGPQAVTATKDAMLGLRVVIEGIEVAIKTVWNIVSGFVATLTVAFVSVGDALDKALHGDFSGAGQALATGGDMMVDIAKEKAGNIVDAFQEAQKGVADAMSGAWDKDKPTKSKSGGEYSAGGDVKEAKPKKAGHQFDAELGDLNAQLAAYRNNMEAKLEIAEQAAARAKQIYGEDSREYAEAKKRIVEIERQATEQIKQQQEIIARTQTDKQLASINTAEEDAKLKVQLGQMTQQQLLQQELQFEQQRYAIKERALQDTLALQAQDPDSDPVKKEAINAEIEALEQAHQDRMRQIKGETVIQEAEWQTKMRSNLQSGYAQTLSKFLQGQATVGQTLRSLFTNIKQTIIQMLAEVMAKQLAQSTLSQILAKKEMIVHAALAAIHAAKSAAQIPFVGWALALGAAGAVFAGLKAMSSAEGGYDIPAGHNPITQLHQREMVLPAKHADVIRSLADNGGAGGGDTVHATVHIHTPDTGGMEELLRNNTGALVRVLSQAYRNGYPVPR